MKHFSVSTGSNRKLATSLAALIFLLVISSSASADILYTLSNFPSDQDGAELSGFITTDGTVDGFITASNVVSWEFTVAKTGFDPYSVSSTDTNAEFRLGSSSDLRATTDQLLVFGRLRIGTGLDVAAQTSVEWRAAGTGTLYFSNFFGNASRGWETINPSGFGSGPAWTIATAVPEPSSGMFVAICSTFFICRRSRKL